MLINMITEDIVDPVVLIQLLAVVCVFLLIFGIMAAACDYIERRNNRKRSERERYNYYHPL